MECSRCGLENMPGTAACFQCGADLSAKPSRPVTMPPRARRPGLRAGVTRTRPARPLLIDRFDKLFGTIPGVTFFATIGKGCLFLVPGLSLAFLGRVRRGYIFAVLPVLAMIIGFAGWRTMMFELAIISVCTIAIGLVVSGAMHFMPDSVKKDQGYRLPLSIAAFVFAGVFLAAIIAVHQFNRYYLMARVNVRWAEPEIARGEQVLGRRVTYGLQKPEKGDILFVRGVRFLAKVVALEGDEVVLGEEDLRVNGTVLYNDGRYVGRAASREERMLLPSGEALLLLFADNGLSPERVKLEEINAKVIGVIYPASRRRWIRN